MNNFKFKHIAPVVLILTSFLSSQKVVAQRADTVLGSTTIEVIQMYKPERKHVPKPVFYPELPPRDTSKPKLKFDVPQQTIFYSYNSLPLSPLALGRDTSFAPYQSFLKLGFGNLSTRLIEGGTTFFRNPYYETNFQFKHWAQTGNIKNQDLSQTSVDAEVKMKRSSHFVQTNINFERNAYSFYGYDHSLYDFSSEDVKQVFTNASIRLKINNDDKTSLFGFNYQPNIYYHYYGDALKANENQIIVQLPFSRIVNEQFNYGLQFNGNWAFFNGEDKSFSNNLYQFNTFFNYLGENYLIRAAVTPTIGKDKNYLLPDLSIQWNLPSIQSGFSLGYINKIKQNTFKQLTTYNPYMFNSYEIKQTTSTDLFASLSTNLGHHVFISGRFSWQQFENLPLFLNDFSDMKNFYIVNDPKVKLISFEANLKYQIADFLGFNTSLMYNKFYEHEQEKVWHEPGLSIKTDLSYQPTENLMLTAYGNVMNQIFSKNRNHETIKLDGIFDIGVGMQYKLFPRLSVFAQVNNLLNNKYMRWNSFQAFGLNAYGGLQFQF